MRRPRTYRSSRASATPTRGSGTDVKGGRGGEEASLPPAKRPRLAIGDGDDAFDRLPDDLVLTVLARVAASAASPADVAAASLTCRRFRELAAHPAVLSRASAAAVGVRAAGWSEGAHRFLQRCAAAGSLHACYFLGMVTKWIPIPLLLRIPLLLCSVSSISSSHVLLLWLLIATSSGAVLLPREQGDGGGAAGAGGGGRARAGVVRAGGGAVQRQRRRQGGQGPASGRRAVRARRVARPRARATRARPLPPGRLRRASRRRRGPAPPSPRRRARAPLVALPRQWRRRRRRGGRGQPVHGGVVGGEHQSDGRQASSWRQRRRRGPAAVLAGAVRAAGDAAARVPAVLGVRLGHLLLPRVPGAPLEARAPRPVRRRALARRRERALSATRSTRRTCTYTYLVHTTVVLSRRFD